MLSESKRPNCWILKKEEIFWCIDSPHCILHSGQQQLHAFCKLEWAKSAIFCTRMTNFTEVLSFELWICNTFTCLAVFARHFHMSSWTLDALVSRTDLSCWVGVCKFWALSWKTSCWISPKHANYRSETDSWKMLIDSTRFIKFLRNFRETCVSCWIILILKTE